MKAEGVVQNLSSDVMERIDGVLGNKPTFGED